MARNDIKPQFFTLLSPGNLEKLAIPPEFNMHILKDDLTTATILSPLGKCWHVSYLREAQKIYFGNGWQEFVRSHDLALGYIIVLCYEGDQVFTFTVFDLTACEVKFAPSSWKNAKPKKTKLDFKHGNLSDVQKPMPCSQKKSGIEHSPSWNKSNKIKKPQTLERVIRDYNLSYGIMDLPLGFSKLNGLLDQTQVTLRDPNGRLWPIVMSHGNSSKNRWGKGWREFCTGNKLQVGDKCVFVLESKGKDVIFKVYIMKKVNNSGVLYYQ